MSSGREARTGGVLSIDHGTKRTGFAVNDSKTHMMYRRSRQDVTGLIVNKKVNVRWEYRHTVRAMV